MRTQVRAIDEAEIKLKQLIVGAVRRSLPYAQTNKEVMHIINDCLREIKSEEVKRLCFTQLKTFASKVYVETIRLNDNKELLLTAIAVAKILGVKVSTGAEKKAQEFTSALYKGNRATANNIYPLEYEKQVIARINYISDMTAKPDYDSRYSLRAVVERQLRQEFHEQQIEGYKSAGINLVWIDSHENCSERCQPYQGKLYSLDNTSGTIDGINYRPLEVATDIFEKTKAGVIYKNGCVSGFNCRHKLIPYEKHGARPVPIKASIIEKQRKLEAQQRLMERTIRKYQTRALTGKADGDMKIYKHNKELVKEWTENYKAFSRENEIPFIPSRLKI